MFFPQLLHLESILFKYSFQKNKYSQIFLRVYNFLSLGLINLDFSRSRLRFFPVIFILIAQIFLLSFFNIPNVSGIIYSAVMEIFDHTFCF